MNSDYIYHITTKAEWENALEKGQYEAATLGVEGFMHCSTEDQVDGVLSRYYQGRKGLVKLKIEKEKVNRPLVFELAGSIDEVFPHIHGALNLNAVVDVVELS